MKDAGCGDETIAEVCRLYGSGRVKDAVKALRRHRCGLMDRLHESQGRVDCLDFLVRRMEKEQRQTDKTKPVEKEREESAKWQK